MEQSVRRVAGDALIYGGGDLLIRAAGFITLPLYTRLLGTEEFGVLSLVLGLQALLNAFLALGGDSAYARFFFERKTRAERGELTTTWFGFLALWGILVVAVAAPFSGQMAEAAFGQPGYAPVILIAFLSGPVQVSSSMFGQALRNEFRAKTFILVNLATVILQVGFGIVALVVLDLGVPGLLGGAVLGGLLMLPIRAYLVRHLLAPLFSRPLLGRLLRFGVPLVPASLAFWVFGLSDRVIVSRLASLDDVGLYGVAIAVASVMQLMVSALGQSWSPHAVQVYEEQGRAAAPFYGRVLTYVVLAFGLVAVAVSAFSREVVAILAPPEFSGAAVAIPPLALGFVAYGSVQVTAMSISLMKRTSWIALIAWVAALINIGLNVLLVPIYGMIAAAWTTFIAYLILTGGYLVVSQRLWPITYEVRRIVPLVLAVFAFSVAGPSLPDLSLFIAIPMKLGWCAAFVLTLIVIGAVDVRERTAMIDTLAMLRARLRRKPRSGSVGGEPAGGGLQ